MGRIQGVKQRGEVTFIQSYHSAAGGVQAYRCHVIDSNACLCHRCLDSHPQRLPPVGGALLCPAGAGVVGGVRA